MMVSIYCIKIKTLCSTGLTLNSCYSEANFFVRDHKQEVLLNTCFPTNISISPSHSFD